MKMLNSLLIMLIFAFMANLSFAQSSKVFGTVTKHNSNAPVEGHWVYLHVNTDSILSQTDATGKYEILYGPVDSTSVTVSTFDPCNGVVTMQWVPQNEPFFEANFSICGDSVPTCQAMFTYIVGSNYDSTSNVSNSMSMLWVNFVDQSYGNPEFWNWDFGDGTTSTEQNPSHQYTDPGYKTVTLSIQNTNCASVYTETILVGQSPTDCYSKFGYEFITIHADSNETEFNVAFFDYSYPNPTQWNWDFGDGTTSTEQNPVHLFNSPGIYNISLVSGNNSCTSSTYEYLVLGDTIITDTACNAMFAYYSTGTITNDSINQPSEGYSFYFENLSTGDFTNVLWNFGDGGYSEDYSASHQYETPGEYLVTLNLFGNCNSSYSQWILIGSNDTIVGPDSCMAIFYTVVSGNCVSFFNKSVGQINTSFWDFGDGEVSSEENPYHCYASEGMYTVSLTVSTDVYTTFFISEVYVGSQFGDSSLSAFFIPLMEGTKVNFINQSVGEITNYHWDFGDGTTSESKNIEHNYSQLGIYIVTLGISNINEVTTYTLEIDLNTGTFKGLAYNITNISDKNENLSLTVYPNPVIESAYMNLDSQTNGYVTVSITNIAGQRVYFNHIEVFSGNNLIEINTQTIPSGMYILKAESAGKTYISKLFKQ